jgi:DNA-binding XRE family transcriptional regulator
MKKPKAQGVPALTKFDLRRRKLGMSRAFLAQLAGVGLTSLTAILRGTEQNPTLSTAHAIATALGMRITLGVDAAISELISVDEMRRRRAVEKARRLAGLVQGTMGLEAQAVDQQTIDSITEQNVHKLLAGPSRRLWED